MKIVSNNKKAYHDYFILDTYEAGIELKGTEIKSVRLGNVNLKDAFVRIKDNEAYIENMHISPYSHGNQFNHEPLRNRKLLLHKKEILKRIIAINMIITSLFCYIPINSFAADADDDEKDEMMEAIVPYAANSIISKFVNINNLSMRQ